MCNPFRVGLPGAAFPRVRSCVATLGCDVKPLRGTEGLQATENVWGVQNSIETRQLEWFAVQRAFTGLHITLSIRIADLHLGLVLGFQRDVPELDPLVAAGLDVEVFDRLELFDRDRHQAGARGAESGRA